MDLIGAYHAALEGVVAISGSSRPMLHLHGGLAIYLAGQLLLGDRRGSLAAIMLTVILVAGHEGLNRLHTGSWRWEDTSGDLAISLFWPTMFYGVSTLRRWRWARRQGVVERAGPAMDTRREVALG